MRMKTSVAFAAFLTVLNGACAPKIYVIDRQTMLEQEAAGEWPQFDRDLIARSAAAGPTPFGELPPSPEQRRLYNVLNGELVAPITGSPGAKERGR